MFQSGDYVFINDSARADICTQAWDYIKDNRRAQIICIYDPGTNVKLPEAETMYVVAWPEPFKGGIDCWHHCIPGHGQFVTQKHMELCFEDSRSVQTVPNIESPV